MSHHLDIFLLFLLSRPLREKRFRISHLSSLFYICFYHIFSPFRRNKMSISSSNVGRLRSSSGFVGCCRCFATSAKSRLKHLRRPTGNVNEIYGDVSRSWTSRKSLRMPLKDWKKMKTKQSRSRVTFPMDLEFFRSLFRTKTDAQESMKIPGRWSFYRSIFWATKSS